MKKQKKKPEPHQFYKKHPGFFYSQYDDFLIFDKDEYYKAIDKWFKENG